jgi:hypothetical protein
MKSTWSVFTTPYFDDREYIALNPFSGYVGTVRRAAARDLVDLVDEYDPRLLGGFHGARDHLVHVDEPLLLLLHEHLPRFLHRDAAPFLPARHHPFEPGGQLEPHLLESGVREYLDQRAGTILDFDRDLARVESAARELPRQLLLRAPPPLIGILPLRALRTGGRGEQEIDETFHGVLLRSRLDFGEGTLLLDGYRDVDEVPDHRIDVPADIAYFRELGRLHLDERRLGEAREPPSDFRFPHAGRADHDNIRRHDLVPDRRVDAPAAPAVPERDCDRALRGVLAYDILVQFFDDLSGGELIHCLQ